MTGEPVQAGEWFDGAGLGLFVHWDHASQQGLELSWPMVGGVFALPRSQDVSVAQYQSSAPTFDPVRWDAPALAALARRAGATYGVFTTRHHAGYSMFFTDHDTFSVEHSPAGRDLVREFVDAFRAEGLRVGLYYSLSDWHHPDYPAFRDEDRPYRLGLSPPLPSAEQHERYLAYLFGQVEELLTGYGPIDLMWFDGGWERPVDWWRSAELDALIRQLQPRILVNDRLPARGDFSTPEQFVPAAPPGGRWEACMTMNDSWGFNPDDTDYKSTRSIVHTLVETGGRGGNLLLNVSPRGDGSLPPEQVERIEGVAAWHARNGEAVHGVVPGFEPWQHYGPSTRRGDRWYAHLLARPYDSVTIRGVPVRRVRQVTELASGQSLAFRTRTGIIDQLLPDPLGELVVEVPGELVDEHATVLAIDVESAGG